MNIISLPKDVLWLIFRKVFYSIWKDESNWFMGSIYEREYVAFPSLRSLFQPEMTKFYSEITKVHPIFLIAIRSKIKVIKAFGTHTLWTFKAGTFN